MKGYSVLIILIATLILLSLTTSAMGISITDFKALEENPYEGYLRVYVVELESRWRDKSGNPYHFGFLDFAFNKTISIDYLETFSKTVVWNGTQAGYSDIQEDNIMVIAAVFNSESHQAYSNPAEKEQRFNAYYVDATAAATPGTTGQNIVNGDFTHTVFCEEGTATYCTPCISTKEALHNIYKSGDYPFYYTALIDDKNVVAHYRTHNDYNARGFPNPWFDGGYKVDLGAGSTIIMEREYRSKIEACGGRDVHKLDISVSLYWLDDSNLEIEISIVNKETNNIVIEIPERRGMGVEAIIKNNGDHNLDDIEWTVRITGGLILRRVRSNAISLDSGDEMAVRSGLIFGISRRDRIKVTVTVSTPTETKASETTGTLFGPILILK